MGKGGNTSTSPREAPEQGERSPSQLSSVSSESSGCMSLKPQLLKSNFTSEEENELVDFIEETSCFYDKSIKMYRPNKRRSNDDDLMASMSERKNRLVDFQKEILDGLRMKK